MRLQDLNWMDVEKYLEQDSRIILVTGATEQHAYLSLFTDILVPSRLALAVADREGVLVAPPLNFGVSNHFSEFPGTVSLSQSTFELVLSEVVESLFHQGFTRFLSSTGMVATAFHSACKISIWMASRGYNGMTDGASVP
jgi:creatinine amidohydrolase